MIEERTTSIMENGRREMTKLSPSTYKSSRVSSCALRHYCSRARIVGDFQAVAVQKRLGASAKHQVALVKRV